MSLSLRDVAVTIDDHRIISGIALAVASGEWTTVIGPNGAGKTTILRSVLGLVAAEGSLEWDGTSLASLPARARARHIAYVPQDATRPPGMTVRAYVLLGRTPHLGPLARESSADLAIVDEVISALAIEEFADRDIATLSGGEAQRAVIARALAQQPRLLVMDEPTSALDLAAQLDVMETIDQVRKDHGIGVLSSTHDLTLAARFVDVVHLVARGRIVEAGPPSEVLTAEIIATHYGADVQVLTDPTGGIIVAPRRSPRRSP
jgi:iron complex transport system ATP-binding protein